MIALKTTLMIVFAVLLSGSCSDISRPIRNESTAAENTEKLTINQEVVDSEEHDGTEARYDYWFIDLSFPF